MTKTIKSMLLAVLLLMSVCSFAQTTVSLFPSGKVTMSEPVEIDMPGESGEYYGYGWYPDGKFCFLPETDGSGWVCYWGEGDTYRTKAATTHLEDHIANNNWQLAFGHSVNKIDGFNDCGSWIIGINRLEKDKLVGFFHAESYWPNTDDPTFKSIGVTYSSDNGLTWEPGQRILASPNPKGNTPLWGLGLGDGCVVWNAKRQQYICYYSNYGLFMAASSDPEGAPGTWKKWDGEDFTIEGCNQETQLGGSDIPIEGLSSIPLTSPSVMYNEYLDCWVMISNYWDEADFYISFSKDGIEWESPTKLLKESGRIAYPNLISDQGDVIGGKSLRLYYSRNMNEWGLRRLAYRTIEFDNSEHIIANILRNSDLEGDDVSCFYSKENGAENGVILPSTIADSAGKDGSRGIVIRSSDYPPQSYNTQFFVRLPQSLPAGTRYRLSFDYKASQNAYVTMESHSEPGDYIWYNFGNMTFTPLWQHYERVATITEEESTDEKNMRTIAFDLAHINTATTYYFDNIVFEIEAEQVKEPVIITADNKTMKYGDDIPTLTYTSMSGDLNGMPKLSTTATKSSSAGIYPIMVERGTVTNDAVIFVGGTLTIEQGPDIEIDLPQHGKATISGGPIVLDQPEPWWPDGKLCFLPETDGSGWVCYWGQGDTYRTKAATTHLEDHIANNNWEWQLAFGHSVNKIDGFNDGGSWIIGINRLENGKLVGFFHAESHWPNDEEGKAYKSIGVTYSYDNGLTWEPGGRIIGANHPKPQEPAWSGLGDGCVVWNAKRQQYICYYSDMRICMAASSDPEATVGSWKKWDGDEFTIEGCNQDTQLGGMDTPIEGLKSIEGSNPSVMWNEYLGCWLMVYSKWGGDIYLSFSKDGIDWEPPVLLVSLEGQGYPSYPNLVSDQGDLIGGKNMRLYYACNFDGGRDLAYRTIEFDNTVENKWANIVLNSDLEGDDVSCFYSIENGAGGGEFKPSTIVDGAGRYKSRGIVVQSADNPPEFWDTQFFVRLPQSLPVGTKYRLSFRGKASQEAYVTMESHAEPGDYIWWDFGSVNFTTSWQNFEIEGTINELQSTDDKKMRTIAFDLARMNTATTYYFDDIVFEIDPSLVEQPVTITAENKTMTYGDDIPALTYTSTGAKLNGTPNLVTTATKTSPVGTYPIKVEQGTVMNSNVTFVDGTLTITQAPLTVGVQDVTITEGDAIPTFTLTYDGWRNSDNADNAFTTMPVASTTATPSSAPGVYPITISGGEATNYALTYTQGTLTIKENETITSGDLVLNGDLEDDELRCFFARENLLENEEIVPATIVNGAGKDGSRGVVLHSANVSSEAEGHNTQLFVRLTQQVPAGTKYRLSFDYKASQNADVWIQTHAEPSDYIWWNFGNVTFTPSWQHFEREGTITDEESTSEKKMRTIAFNLAENKSATIYYFDNISFIINPAPVEQPVTITANNLTMIYGDEVPELTFTSKGAALEGTPKLSTTATKTSPVGTYPIKVEQGTVTNTKVTYVDGTLTITKAPLTIKAGTYTRKQGEVNPEFTLSYEGFKNNETKDVLKKQPTVSCNATESSVPGKYPVTVSGAEATNYEITYVNGTLIVTAASFKLTYLVDGEVYKTYDIEYGTAITPEPAPTKEGYTFSGWSKIPETMPAHDVTVTGTFAVNQYTITYVIDNEVYTTQRVDYGSIIVPPVAPTREGYDFAWSDYPETMPAYDITIYGTYTTGIEAIIAGEANCQIFSLDGKPLNKPQKGVNIVRMGNGQVRKVVVK